MKNPTFTLRIFVLTITLAISASGLQAYTISNKLAGSGLSAILGSSYSSLPLPVGDKMNINWSGWNNYPNTNLFYRIEIVPAGSTNATVAVEILNNYKREVSVRVALNDDGLKTEYQQIKNLKKESSTVINYPRPKNTNQFFAFFNNVELN